ncbi:AEC family transporter [Isoalcanivorax pacificus W11-5]|uniref:AEC family transporter n=1 Tax=Isoalcanivorax pacificus W11-5 TaxID=391936 RepID=A0A0B4XKX7_9GAMM|nr:AEC family transporter [Isoalcanivorax pacificus]AJD47766.1 AEC family transporter [Isoalcanivorax pacificus W11-5]
MVAQIFGIIAPVLVCVLIGFVWVRRGRPFDTGMVSSLVMYIGAPCLIVATLSAVSLSQAALLEVAALYGAVLVLTALAALAVIRLSGVSLRVYFTAMTFPNVGNMGLPLCLLAFGEQGLVLGLAWFMLNSIGHFSLGVVVVSGQSFLRELFTNPVVVSVAIAVLMVVTGWRLPAWLFNTVELIGGMTIPMMLITLGVSLGQLQVAGLGRATGFALLRLLMGFGVGFLVCELFAVEGALRGVVLIQSSMPVAVFNYLFAQRYRQGPQEVAGMVVVSTALAFVLLPVLLGYVLRG